MNYRFQYVQHMFGLGYIDMYETVCELSVANKDGYSSTVISVLWCTLLWLNMVLANVDLTTTPANIQCIPARLDF